MSEAQRGEALLAARPSVGGGRRQLGCLSAAGAAPRHAMASDAARRASKMQPFARAFGARRDGLAVPDTCALYMLDNI